MIDYFALALTHGLIVFALLRIAGRPELDREEFEPGADGTPDRSGTAAKRRAKGRRRDA